MKWLNDPFRGFLTLYGLLIVISIIFLFFAKQNLNDWFLEKSARPLLDAQLTIIENKWSNEGPSLTRRYLKQNTATLFDYQLSKPTTSKSLSCCTSNKEKHHKTNPENKEKRNHHFTINTLTKGETTEHSATIATILPAGNYWQQLTISINLDYFQQQFSSFNVLIYTIVTILLLGYLIALLAINKIKRRLVDINQTSQVIRKLNDLTQTIPADNLTGPLAETIEQLNLMLMDIQHSVDMTKQQANNIAHDLRTPLTMVYNKVQLLSAQHPDLAELEVLLGKLLNTFNLLLRIHRLESNGESAKLTRLPLNDIVNDVTDLYLPVLEEKEQVLTYKIDGNIKVLASADLLFQAICNVVDNASKFSPNHAQIEIFAEQKNSSVSLFIADQSGGVNSQEQQKLCDKFYRSDSSRHSNGNGLGLSFVRAAIERMGGTLSITNRTTNGKRGLSVQITLTC